MICLSIQNERFLLTPKMRECWCAERRGLRSKASLTLCRFSGVRTVHGAPCFTANSEHATSFFQFLHPIQYGIPRRYAIMSTNTEWSSKDTLNFWHRLCLVITRNTCNTLLHVPALHCDRPYEMVSSPLPFPFLPTTTSYRASAIFKFEMCQSAPRHPVYNIKHRFCHI